MARWDAPTQSKKYRDDEGGRRRAVYTYYGFLNIFSQLPGMAVLSRVLTLS